MSDIVIRMSQNIKDEGKLRESVTHRPTLKNA